VRKKYQWEILQTLAVHIHFTASSVVQYICTLLYALQRLQAKIIKLVDVSYGGENGFNQAIELAAESLQNVKFIQEKKLIGNITVVCMSSAVTVNDAGQKL
jgi:hypothetical protein